VKDPLSKDITSALVQDNSDFLIGTSLNKSDSTKLHPNKNLANIQTEEIKYFSKQGITEESQIQDMDYQKENQPNSGNTSFIYSNNKEDISSATEFRLMKEQKDPSVNYLSYKLLNEFYESILYISDLSFALSVAETLYTKVRLNDDEFINTPACYYYANKKNMLVTELIESIYQIFNKNKNKSFESYTTLTGRVEKIGNKYTQEVLTFTPDEPPEYVEAKVSRRGLADSRDVYYQIAEGEFVLLSYANDNYLLSQLQGNALQNKNPLSFLYQPSKELQMAQNQHQNLNLGSGMIACVKEISKDYKLKLFILPTPEQSAMIAEKDKLWRITKLANKATIDKTSEALEIFTSKITMAPALLQILLTPPNGDSKKIQQLAESSPVIEGRNYPNLVTNLNESQQQALRAASKQLLTLIQGPPGTGKTTTAVEIVLEWLRSSRQPILACADSNIAIDLLHSEFLRAGIKAIRIGPGYDDRNEFKNDKNYKIYNDLYNSKQYQNANNVRYGIMKRMLNEAQVVCATCVGSTSEYLKGMSFTRVIIDEATQATEMSSLIPLIRNCQQLVLIGDHKQLPPTVISTFAQSKGMTISLFERLIRQGIKPHLLNIQYRMHPSIAIFPSHQFYNNMLENGVADEHRPIVPGFVWPNSLVRVAFINVKGDEQAYCSSILNPK